MVGSFMSFFQDLKRKIDIKFFHQCLLENFLSKYKENLTIDLINQYKGKKVLMFHASPFNHKMLKQRPHHFLDFWAKHFDCVFY